MYHYLFYIAKAYSIPIVQPLIAYLQAQGHTDFMLYISDRVLANLPADWNDFLITQELDAAIAFQPDFVLCPGNFVDFRLPGIKVQIFHGLGEEKASHYKIRHFFDVYCTSGPDVTAKFQALQQRYGYFLVEETGWPKVDYILHYPADNVREQFAVPPGKKVILYAPTFSKKMESASVILPELPNILRPDEICFVKFHELMARELKEQLAEMANGQIQPVTHYDITPLLHLADVMVSDTSSVLYEFMFLDKPVVTYRATARLDKGIDIHDVAELRPALDRSLAQPAEFQTNRERYLDAINPRRDGTVSHFLLDTLHRIKAEDRLRDKRKPLNLFRKLQVLYHYHFKKGYLR